MIVVRNLTGGPASLPSVNVLDDVAAGATVDLTEDLGDGEVRNFPGDLYTDPELRAAVASAAWAVVIDDQDLTGAEGLAALSPVAQASQGALRLIARGDKRHVLEATNVVVGGRICFKLREVSAAELAANDGVLVVALAEAQGTWVEIEAGAVLNGIQITGDDADDDVTASSTTHVTMLTLQSSDAPPYFFTAVHDHAGTPEHQRLRVTGMTPGSYGSGPVTENHVLLGYDPKRQRWRVPWTAA